MASDEHPKLPESQVQSENNFSLHDHIIYTESIGNKYFANCLKSKSSCKAKNGPSGGPSLVSRTNGQTGNNVTHSKN